MKEIEEFKNEVIEKIWKKFKSPLGYSSIDNKYNSMYDLGGFITTLIDKAYKKGFQKGYDEGFGAKSDIDSNI